MKNFKEKLKKITASLTHLFSKSDYQKSGVYQVKDWLIILSVFFTGLILSGFLAIYLDNAVIAGSFWVTVSDNQVIPVHTINQKNLHTVIDSFNQKQKNINDIENSSKTFPDPSL